MSLDLDTHLSEYGPPHAATRRQHGSEDTLAARISDRYRSGLLVANFYLSKRRTMCADAAVALTAKHTMSTHAETCRTLDYMGINLRTRDGL